MTYKASLDFFLNHLQAVTLFFCAIIAVEIERLKSGYFFAPVSAILLFLTINFVIFLFHPIAYKMTTDQKALG